MRTHSQSCRRQCSQSERGVAVLTVLMITAILMILVASNIRTLNHVQKELSLIEQKEMKDLHTTAGKK